MAVIGEWMHGRWPTLGLLPAGPAQGVPESRRWSFSFAGSGFSSTDDERAAPFLTHARGLGSGPAVAWAAREDRTPFLEASPTLPFSFRRSRQSRKLATVLYNGGRRAAIS